MRSVAIPVVCALLLLHCLPTQAFWKWFDDDENNCASCNSAASCAKPESVTCDEQQAMKTSYHLNKYRVDVDMEEKSDSFECFTEKTTIVDGSTYEYKGCIFDSLKGCDKELREEWRYTGNHIDVCNQTETSSATSWTNFSPAERTTTGLIAGLGAIALSCYCI